VILDDGDNDPALFLGYLIAALQTAAPALGETAVYLLQSLPPPMPEVVLTAVINELTAVTGVYYSRRGSRPPRR
jgi:LuxR family transcriptional regulator, maltose regulon positive regulatory protein